MTPPPLPSDEVQRLQALKGYALLDTLPEQSLDDLTALAAQICATPIALISLVDEQRQWFKSKVGISVCETPRDISFCGHAILQPGLFIIPDATLDHRFADNPLVTGEPQVRFYAGAPLVTSAGHALGALCLMDRVPRELTDKQQEALLRLARQVMSQLELHRQTRELMESELRLQIVTENARVGLFMLDRDRRYLYASKAYAEIVNRPLADLIGLAMPELLADIYEEHVRPQLDRAFAGERVSFETIRYLPAGIHHYSAVYEPRTNNGIVTLVVGVITDITESKLAKQALRDSNARLDFALQASHTGAWELDVAKRTANCTLLHHQIFGYEKLLPHWNFETFLSHVLPEDRAGVETHFHAATANRTALDFECRIRRVDGQIRWIWCSGGYQEDGTGVTSRLSGIITDITARKLAEMASDRLAAIVEFSDDAIIGKDLDGLITSWNHGAEKLFGYTAEEMIGTSILRLIPADCHAEETFILDQIKSGKSVAHFETRRQTKDGSLIDVSVTASPIMDAGGKVIGVSKVARNITARRQAEERARWLSSFPERNPNSVLELDLVSGLFHYINPSALRQFPDLVVKGIHHPLVAGVAALLDASADWQPVHRELAVGAFCYSQMITFDPGSKRVRLYSSDITQRKRAQTALQLRQSHSQSLLQLSKRLEHLETLPEVLQAAREAINASLGLNRLWFYQLTPEREHFKLIMVSDDASTLTPPHADGALLPIAGDPMLEEIALSRDIVLVEDARTDPRTNKDIVNRLGNRTIINIPVTLAGNKIATLGTGTFGTEGVRTLAALEQEFLTAVASHLAAVIDRISASEARLRAEQELRASEERLRIVTNTAQVGLVIVDQEHRYLYANPAYARILHLPSHEFVGQRVADVLPAVYYQQIRPRLDRAFAGERVNFELGMSSSGSAGQDHFYDVIYELGFAPTGRVVVVVIVDITDRKLAEQSVKESESALQEAHRLAKLGNWKWNHLTGEHFWSPEIFSIYGRDPQSGPADEKEVAQYFTPESWSQLLNTIDSSVRNNVAYECDAEVVRPDGTHRWITARGETMQDATGRFLGLRGTVQDISARKLAELSLRESEERFRQLAENINEVFWITDPTKNEMLYISPAYEKIWGRTCASLYAAPHTWLDVIHPEDRPRVQGSSQSKQAIGEYDEIYRISRPDGSVRWIHDRAFPIRIAAGMVHRIVGTAEDITDRRLLEEQFRQAQKMEAIGQLAGGVAHDFNNILAAMMMQTELARMTEDLPEEVQQGLTEIHASAERAANLTRQLLLFSRKQVMNTRELDLNEIVTSLFKMLQRIIGEHLTLQFNLYPGSLGIHADAGMLDQVLMNLVVNARDAMPSGGRIFIATKIKVLNKAEAAEIPETTAGNYAMLSVTDTGTGIAPEILTRIFEPFFTTKAPGKGTGLGLATVFGIVKQHGGSLTVESIVGQGTTFNILLPLSAEPDRGPAPLTARLKPRGGTETILLVEDDSSVRHLTRITLERAGYTVLVASNGHQALNVWNEHRGSIQLLLTDIVMPEGMTGRDLATRLQEQNPRLPVILTSGYSSDIAGRELSLEHGQKFIQKPAPPHELLAAIRHSLDQLPH